MLFNRAVLPLSSRTLTELEAAGLVTLADKGYLGSALPGASLFPAATRHTFTRT